MAGIISEYSGKADAIHLIGASTLEALEDACICFDQDFLVLEANEAACALLGHSAENIVGRNLTAFLSLGDGSSEKNMAATLFRHSDWASARKDWAEFSLQSAEGPPLGVVVASVKSIGENSGFCTALIRSTDCDRGVLTLSREELADAHMAKQRFLFQLCHFQ